MEQGQEFGADTDNIVLHGISSGGHLATALPFRLKRYGFSTKGVVVDRPITDERQIYPSSQPVRRTSCYGAGTQTKKIWIFT